MTSKIHVENVWWDSNYINCFMDENEDFCKLLRACISLVWILQLSSYSVKTSDVQEDDLSHQHSPPQRRRNDPTKDQPYACANKMCKIGIYWITDTQAKVKS